MSEANVYYIKRGTRYIKCGYDRPNMGTGLYFHQETKYGSRTTSVAYWIGSSGASVVDVDRLISLMKHDEELSAYLGKLMDDSSNEFEKLKKIEGGYINGPLQIGGISRAGLATAILRFLSTRSTTSEDEIL